MNYWLAKSEPSAYSWENLVKDKKVTWDGIRSYAARKNLRNMKKGDLVYFYHSNEGLEIAGIAIVTREAYQDPTTQEDWSAVDLAPYQALKRRVSLSEIKSVKSLQNIYLIRQGRLSVMPLQKAEFDQLLKMSERI